MWSHAYSYLLIAFLCFFNIANFSAVSCAQEEFTPFVAVTTGDNVNVRAGQSANFERLCQLRLNEEVLVVDKEFSWYKIQLPPSAKSYVSKEYVQFLGQNAGGVIAESVNIRAGTGIHNTVLGQLSQGEQIFIQEDLEDWYRIEPVQGSYGWVYDEFLVFKSKDISAYKVDPVARVKVDLPQESKSEKIVLTDVGSRDNEGEIPANFGRLLKQETEQKEVAEPTEPVALSNKPVVTRTKTVLNKENNTAKISDDQIIVRKAATAQRSQKKKVSPETEFKSPAADLPEEAEEKESVPVVKPVSVVQDKMVVPKEDEPERILTAIGYVEEFEKPGKDGIIYKIIKNGTPICYVQGKNQMLGRFIHHQVTVEGTVNQGLRTKYEYPVISVYKVRLML